MSDAHLIDITAQLELAWAAGFFDGEGWTSAHLDKRNGYCQVAVGVSQVEREPLERFMRAVGLGTIYGPYVSRGRFGKKPQHHWKARGLTAREVLKRLWPYLAGVKRAQATLALEADNSSGRPKNSKKTHCPQGHEYSGDNLRLKPNGHRGCRTCELEQQRARARKKREGHHGRDVRQEKR